MYFHLVNHCMFEQGKFGGVIYNLVSGEVVSLMKEESETLRKSELGTPISATDEGFETLENLAAMEWGFFDENRYFIDKIRKSNNFLRSRHDLDVFPITTATLQLTSECDSKNSKCGEYFCSPCRKQSSHTKTLSVDKWIDVIDVLCDAGTNQFILTGGNVFLYDGFYEILNYLKNKNANISIVVRSLDNFDDIIFSNTHIILFPCDYNKTDNFTEITKHKNITLLSHENVDHDLISQFEQACLNITKITLNNHTYGLHSMLPCDLNRFYQRKYSDMCLFGNIYVDYLSNIIPCLGRRDIVVGNMLSESFSSIFKKLISEYWSSSIRGNTKCSNCQWFYSCTSCRFTDTEKQCSFNIESGTFE